MELQLLVRQGLLIIELCDHTHTQPRYDSSGRVTSPTQRPLPDNTLLSQQTDLHARGAIESCNTRKPPATDVLERAATGIGRNICNGRGFSLSI